MSYLEMINSSVQPSQHIISVIRFFILIRLVLIHDVNQLLFQPGLSRETGVQHRVNLPLECAYSLCDISLSIILVVLPSFLFSFQLPVFTLLSVNHEELTECQRRKETDKQNWK